MRDADRPSPAPRNAPRDQRSRLALVRPMASDIRAVRQRSQFVAMALSLGLSMMAWRAWTISIEHHDDLAVRGNRQQLRTYTLDASRGNIVDRNYVALAVTDRVDMLVLNPRLLHARNEGQRVGDALLEILGRDRRNELKLHLSKTDKAYRRFRDHLTPEQAKAVRAAKLPGVRLEPAPFRVYPREDLASHVIGRVNRQGKGNLGVELGLDEMLRGRDSSSPAYFASHRGKSKRLLVDGHPDHSVSRGHTVVLSIDSAIQAMAEEELATLVRNWHPVGASVVVLDPSTGEVMALANLPTFDPNHPVPSASDTINLAVQGAYEPGSTMKVITVAAALDQGTIRKQQKFDGKRGYWQYTPKNPIRDTHRSGWIDVTQCLALSSNICTTMIYETLGKEALHGWLRRFHFGERPAIQVPGAASGILHDWRKWSNIKGANVSFGQGVSASPLQIATAFAALANRGRYNDPTLVRQIIADGGETVWEHEPTLEAVVRPSTAKTMLEMLTAVVHTKEGTGRNAAIDGYRVTGKTSTAQKADPEGGYFKHRYYASFVGAVPAHNPRVVILVSVDDPEGGHYGNQVAAPTFSRVGARIMRYLGVPRLEPDPEQAAPTKLDSHLVRSSRMPTESTPFVDENSEGEEPKLPGRRDVTFSLELPDFAGMSMPEAIAAASKAKVELQATGTGYAIGQDIAPGLVPENTIVTVHFAPPQ